MLAERRGRTGATHGRRRALPEAELEERRAEPAWIARRIGELEERIPLLVAERGQPTPVDAKGLLGAEPGLEAREHLGQAPRAAIARRAGQEVHRNPGAGGEPHQHLAIDGYVFGGVHGEVTEREAVLPRQRSPAE